MKPQVARTTEGARDTAKTAHDEAMHRFSHKSLTPDHHKIKLSPHIEIDPKQKSMLLKV